MTARVSARAANDEWRTRCRCARILAIGPDVPSDTLVTIRTNPERPCCPVSAGGPKRESTEGDS